MTPLIDSDEKWLDVVGYEGLYAVSDKGRVYSQSRTEFVTSVRTGGHYRYRNACLLVPKNSKLGYPQVGLYKDGVCKRKTVHRLVAEAFIPNPEGLKEVNHKDGDKANSLLCNLEWCTRSQNSLHSTRTLGKNRGEDNSVSKLTERNISEIIKLLESGESQTQIAEKFGVSSHAIYRIRHGFNWAWLTGYFRKEDLCRVE